MSDRMRTKANRTDEQLLIRMPKDMKKRIQRSAMLNGRSMNGEILYRLKQSLLEDKDENE